MNKILKEQDCYWFEFAKKCNFKNQFLSFRNFLNQIFNTITWVSDSLKYTNLVLKRRRIQRKHKSRLLKF